MSLGSGGRRSRSFLEDGCITTMLWVYPRERGFFFFYLYRRYKQGMVDIVRPFRPSCLLGCLCHQMDATKAEIPSRVGKETMIPTGLRRRLNSR